MMSDKMALKVAIDLMHVPSRVRLLRSEPLPDGVLTVLRIAVGDGEAVRLAVDITGRSKEVVRRAAAFFIEQILFATNADSYRVLGADSQANISELRRNVALLLRWLHPDLDNAGERSVFVNRVTEAWNNLKTPERRAAYDNHLLGYSRFKSGSRRKPRRWRSGRPSNSWSSANGETNVRLGASRTANMGIGKVSFFRRALSVLFNRPLP
jgi:hypothetical protein